MCDIYQRQSTSPPIKLQIRPQPTWPRPVSSPCQPPPVPTSSSRCRSARDRRVSPTEHSPGSTMMTEQGVEPITAPPTPTSASTTASTSTIVKVEKTKTTKKTQKSGPSPSSLLNMSDRDPTGMNEHCKVTFEEVFAEPDPGIFSFDIIWKTAFTTFMMTKLWCYRLLTLFCAIPAACCWGCEFACLSFCTIWCWMPALRELSILCHVQKVRLRMVIEACCEPLFYSCGKVFSSIVINVRRQD